MSGQQRANVTGDHFLGQRVTARTPHPALVQESQPQNHGDGGRQGHWNREPGKNKPAVGSLLHLGFGRRKNRLNLLQKGIRDFKSDLRVIQQSAYGSSSLEKLLASGAPAQMLL